jgi:hypothetical protein
VLPLEGIGEVRCVRTVICEPSIVFFTFFDHRVTKLVPVLIVIRYEVMETIESGWLHEPEDECAICL